MNSLSKSAECQASFEKATSYRNSQYKATQGEELIKTGEFRGDFGAGRRLESESQFELDAKKSNQEGR